MSKVSREVLLERTTEAEVFQDMDNFDLLNDSSIFALSLRLQFPKFSKGFTSSDFEPFVRSHVGEGNLVSLGRLSFPNEWQMQVTNKDVRESLIRMGRTKINTRTCWITPLSQSEVRGYIHWIPTAVSNKKLETLLRAYGEVLLMENQKQSKWTTKVESDARYFGLYLKSGKTMDDVPHFIRVNDYHGLITIRGRNPACFHCKEVGHRKSECKKFREKISDYSLRPPHSGKPRLKARGKRHNPKKNSDPKAMDQGIQAGEGMATCPECRKEQLAVMKAAEAQQVSAAEAQLVSAAEAQLVSAAEAHLVSAAEAQLVSAAEAQLVSAAEAFSLQVPAGESHQVSAAVGFKLSSVVTTETEFVATSSRKVEMDTLASLPNVQEFQSAASRKTKKQVKKEELAATVEEAPKGPFLDLAEEGKDLAGKPEEKLDSSTKNSSNTTNVIPEQKSGDVDLGPLSRLEQLQRNVEEILAKTKENLDLEFEVSRQILAKEAEKPAVAPEGKKKKKRRKKKKLVVDLELGPSAEPKDCL